jgi:hypothetical protein
MAVYPYPGVTGNPAIMAIKINKALGITIGGMSSDGESFSVLTDSDLTSDQQTLLDTTMADPNVGAIPTTTHSVFKGSDPMGNIAALEVATGLTFTAYPGTAPDASVTYVFDSTLTLSNIIALKTALGGLFTQLQ